MRIEFRCSTATALISPLAALLVLTGTACKPRTFNDRAPSDSGAKAAWSSDAALGVDTLENGDLLNSGNLKDGQLVLTIDESPYYDWTDKLAVSLKSGSISQLAGGPISAVFFVVANKVFDKIDAITLPGPGSRLIRIDAASPHFVAKRFDAIIANGHYVANHTFSHPVSGVETPFDKAKLGFDGMFKNGGQAGKDQSVNEVIWTHQVIMEALKKSNPTGDRYLRWFRPSGGSWAGLAQGTYIKNAIDSNPGVKASAANYAGPVGWSSPGRGLKPDWECMREVGMKPTEASVRALAADCVKKNYLPDLAAMKYKGLVLFHGNLVVEAEGKKLYFSELVMEEFVKQAKTASSSVKFVEPTCFTRGC